MFLYNSQANEWIEIDHKLIADALLIFITDNMLQENKDWVSHLLSVLWSAHTTVQSTIRMISFHMLFEYECVLLIELDISMWQTLSWNTVWITAELITMQARQIEHQNQDSTFLIIMRIVMMIVQNNLQMTERKLILRRKMKIEFLQKRNLLFWFSSLY